MLLKLYILSKLIHQIETNIQIQIYTVRSKMSLKEYFHETKQKVAHGSKLIKVTTCTVPPLLDRFVLFFTLTFLFIYALEK